MSKEISLVDMTSGQKGVINRILGGRGVINRLEALGIRPGQEVVKISSMLLSGPIIVKVGETEIAIGRGMAKKIFINLSSS